jgi:LPXTG-site transpeptidase (sortase) family protein
MATREKITTILVGCVVGVAAVVFATTLVHATIYAPEDTAVVATSSVPVVAQLAYPKRLQIPALSIDANVQYVGINGKGNMGVPNNFTDVAWYKDGTVPGQLGSAVIDGHVDNGLGLDGVFKHLSDIKIGDDIYVETADQQNVMHFVVDDIELYPYKDVPTDLVFNQTDAARLNLVTCDGAWVKGDKTYDHRLVVYAKLVKG